MIQSKVPFHLPLVTFTDLCYPVVFFLTNTFKLFSFPICQQINVYKGQPNLPIEEHCI
jgi:hypothetical protein